jgi:hypothetical protein
MEFKEVIHHPVPHIRIENVFSEETLEFFNELIHGELFHNKTKMYDLFRPINGDYSTHILDAYREVYKNRFDLANTLGVTLPEGRHSERSTIQGYKGPSEYNLHLDTNQKIMTSVVYLSPEQNVGTKFYENGKGDGMYEDPWKVNCGYIFCRSENSWHNYENPQNNLRWVAMYNIQCV